MKNAAKKWYNYLIILGILGIIFGCAYTPMKVFGEENWPAQYVCYFLTFAGVVLALCGFIAQDIYKGVIRRRLNDWDNKLEQKYLNKAWSIYFPLLFSGALAFIAGIIANFFVK